MFYTQIVSSKPDTGGSRCSTHRLYVVNLAQEEAIVLHRLYVVNLAQEEAFVLQTYCT